MVNTPETPINFVNIALNTFQWQYQMSPQMGATSIDTFNGRVVVIGTYVTQQSVNGAYLYTKYYTDLYEIPCSSLKIDPNTKVITGAIPPFINMNDSTIILLLLDNTVPTADALASFPSTVTNI